MNSQLLRSPPKPCSSTSGSPAPRPCAQVAQSPPADLGRGGRGLGLLAASPGTKRGLELGDEGVDLGVGHRRVGDHAEQAADRDDVADARHPAAQHARRRGLDHAVDLLGLDLGDLVADGDLRALVDEPVDEPALGHRQAPLGHAELVDCVRLAAVMPGPDLPPVVPRTASAIVAGVGT